MRNCVRALAPRLLLASAAMTFVSTVSLGTSLYAQARPTPVGATTAAERAPAQAAMLVSGAVFDSLARRPLPGALVQLVSSDSAIEFGRTVTSDLNGRFAFDSVPDGKYTIGFYHPMLDSLGLEPLLRGVSIARQTPVKMDLAIPSPARMRAVICGPQSSQNGGAVIVGFVRDAKGRAPASEVTVTAEWLELTFGLGKVVRRIPRKTSVTRETGWFSICDAPSPGNVMLMASRGADSTDIVEVKVPAEGFVRRELYLGAARTIAVNAASTPADTSARVRRVHVGDGQLSGTVVAAENPNRPLSGATVSIVNGPQARANERGEWTITNAPPGTRTLEVRALGYYPERRPVDVIDSAPPVRVGLATLKSVLDTVRVTAAAMMTNSLVEFESRRRTSGFGRFITSQDVAKRNLMVTSDLFKNFPGVYNDAGNTDPEPRITMRGIFTERCDPAIYVNGALMTGLLAPDLDMFVRPRDIVGIEIYQSGQVPPQFQAGLTGCGSLVFWTR